ncbi:MAG: radical SAM protein [Candidatus Thermoplasmatota archaeon]
MKVLFIYPNLMLQATIPNSIAILSACLKKEGHIVKLFDTTYYKTEEISNEEKRIQRFQIKPFEIKKLIETPVEEDLIKTVELYKPELIAITFVDNTLQLGIRLLRKIRHTKIPVIAGGVTAILRPEELASKEEIDYVCYGEGENAIVKIIEYLEGKLPLQDVPNICYRSTKGKKTTIMYNKPDDLVDINIIPFEDYTIFDQERLMRPMSGKIIKTVTINMDRGCPYSCTYCCAPSLRKHYGKGYYRRKTIERIQAELEYQIKLHQPKYIYFNSETFLAVSDEEFKRFAEMYKNYQIPFWCQTHIKTITDVKIRLLKEIGCDKIGIGIESGNENYRKNRLKKTFTNNEAIEAFKILDKYNVAVGVNNIIGLPEETRKLIFDTIRLNRRLNKILHGRMSTSGFIFQPYKGTELYTYCINNKYLSPDQEPDTLIGDPVIENPYLSKQELSGLLRTFSLYVKMPIWYYPLIRIAEKNDTMLAFVGKIFWKKYAG